jgi:hypothetical protein
MPFYTNQVEKAISLIWSQNDACISHGLIHIHKIHYRLNLEGVITFLPMVYYVGFHIGYIRCFCSRFPSGSPKIVKLCGSPFCKVITFSNPPWFESYWRQNYKFKRNSSTMYFTPQLELIWSLCWTTKWSRVILVVYFIAFQMVIMCTLEVFVKGLKPHFNIMIFELRPFQLSKESQSLTRFGFQILIQRFGTP